jgi:hypothetical protein
MDTAQEIIDRLGGSAEVARETGFPLTTIESWKGANFIPEWRRDALLALASRKSKPLSTVDFPCRRPRTRGAPADQAAA